MACSGFKAFGVEYHCWVTAALIKHADLQPRDRP